MRAQRKGYARGPMREHEKPFRDLTVDELYAILALRQEVFVVEQTCPYLDCDGHDRAAIHLWTTEGAGDAGPLASNGEGRVIAYARALPPGEKFAEASLGRVISAGHARRTGAGRAIVARALAALARAHGPVPVRISAQSYLQRFYEGFGFSRVSEEYLEDDIPHVEMLRPASSSPGDP
jgi:ElaA protein